MKIPALEKDREELYRDLIRRCFLSRADRIARYNILKSWFLFGRSDAQEPVEYNKIFSHIDLLSSFLFAGETTSFVVEVPKISGINYELETKKAQILTPRMNDVWHDTNIDLTFNDALIWALIFDTTFIKLIPVGKGQFNSYVVEPHSFGVLREDINNLDQQEAMVHEFFMPESQLRRKIKHYGKEQQNRILSYLLPKEQVDDIESVPKGVETIIVNATKPDTGEVSGEVNNVFSLNYTLQPVIAENGVMCQEIWVYDDDLKDYRKATMVAGDVLLIDAGENTFVPNEHPFIKVTPNPLYNYFWGRSEIANLIKLQTWVNERIPQIKSILAKIADPPTSGFGVDESKLAALRVAGGIAAFADPPSLGSITPHYPQTPVDLFRELQMIEQMFDDQTGIREIMKGGGESGVRAMGHADLLSRLGSTRAKKKASILEDAVEKCATLLFKGVREYDDTYFELDLEPGQEGKEPLKFIARQITDLAVVKVDAHSSSPIFIEQQMDKAVMLFDRKAIDEEDLIDAVRYQNAGLIKQKLRKRKEAEAKQAAAQQAAEAQQKAGAAKK